MSVRSASKRAGSRKARLRQHDEALKTITMSPGTPLAAGFQPLSDDAMRRVHNAALDLLEQVGMATPHNG